LVRQQLEICIFSNLATEFKTGDACVVVRQCRFREQLLSHAECEPDRKRILSLEFPANSDEFVKHLQDKLAEVASVVDEICAVDKQFTINKRTCT